LKVSGKVGTLKRKLASIAKFFVLSFLKWLAATFAIFASFIASWYFLLLLETMRSGSGLQKGDKLVESSIAEKILDNSGDIIGELGGGGSIYLIPGTRHLITNYHVTAAMCPGRDCGLLFAKVHSRGNNSSPDSVMAVKRCSRWLDVCLLGPATESLQMTPELTDMDVRVGDEIFVAAKHYEDPEGQRIRVGHIEAMTPSLITANLHIRIGFSGSPAFNKNGKFIGILKAYSSRYAFDPGNLFDLLGINIKEWYRSRTLIIPEPALQKTILCSLEPTRCLIEELQLFIADFESYLITAAPDFDNKTIFLANFQRFWNDFQIRMASMIREDDEDIAFIRQTHSLAHAMNFDQNHAAAIENRLQDPFWYKVRLAIVTHDLLSSDKEWDYKDIAKAIRSRKTSGDAHFQNQLAAFLESN
jgi:hypothetical protein